MDFSTYFAREGRAKKLYPVVHVRDLNDAERNTRTAFENGADGVFLISHDRFVTGEYLMGIADEIREEWPGRFIGVNLLDKRSAETLRLVVEARGELNAFWVDNPEIGDDVPFKTLLFNILMEKRSFSGYYFASVAFKYQPPVNDLALAAQNGSQHAHVVVTSGDQTGSPPTVEKIRTMKEAIPNHPLAIASGMTCENIHLFLPYADIFMVATGISDKDDNLDPRLVDQMATIIKNYNKSAELLT